MDLIDRAVAIEEVDDTVTSVSVCATVEQARGATWAKKRIRERLEKMPTIEAVPLDKLCDWLANSFSDPPCCTLENVRCKMECRGFTQMDYSECWRYVLTKWMEGLDAEKED